MDNRWCPQKQNTKHKPTRAGACGASDSLDGSKKKVHPNFLRHVLWNQTLTMLNKRIRCSLVDPDSELLQLFVWINKPNSHAARSNFCMPSFAGRVVKHVFPILRHLVSLSNFCTILDLSRVLTSSNIFFGAAMYYEKGLGHWSQGAFPWWEQLFVMLELSMSWLYWETDQVQSRRLI